MTLFLKKEALTDKPRKTIFVLVSVVAAISVGYILALAILAPQQLAEATAAASDLICSGCVGTSDIADSAVTTGKIGTSQVTNTDIATNAVTTGKISDTAGVQSVDIVNGQVANSDLATSAVSSSKISDTAGVQSVDIVNGQVKSEDIADGTITSTDIASGTIDLDVVPRQGGTVNIVAGETGVATANCETGEILSGGGFFGTADTVHVTISRPLDLATWQVVAFNDSTQGVSLTAYALCIDYSIP
jgi:hypothetical protein